MQRITLRCDHPGCAQTRDLRWQQPTDLYSFEAEFTYQSRQNPALAQGWRVRWSNDAQAWLWSCPAHATTSASDRTHP